MSFVGDNKKEADSIDNHVKNDDTHTNGDNVCGDEEQSDTGWYIEIIYNTL